jgi:hypothetical protein
MRTSGGRLGLVAGALLLATAAGAADLVVVEDWSNYPVGTTGVPADWKSQNWGDPEYDFTVMLNDDRKVLRLRSKTDSSTIARDIRSKVNLKETPVLEWRWKAVTLPKGANSCKNATDDQAAQIFVVWTRFPQTIRSRIIGYVWDTTAKVGTICKSEKTGTVTYMVIRSGETDLGKWFTEQRNVWEDFRKIYREEPENPSAISLAIDSNDTESSAESFFGSIVFRKP